MEFGIPENIAHQLSKDSCTGFPGQQAPKAYKKHENF